MSKSNNLLKSKSLELISNGKHLESILESEELKSNSELESDNSELKSNSELESDNSELESDNSESISEDDIIEQTDNLDLEGSIINKYNILTELGRGSYSIVWLGYNIESSKYYAIKVQHPNEYKEGIEENKFMKKLPLYIDSLNKLIDDFVVIRDEKKFLCSVYELHCANLDCIIRKGNYNNGLPEHIAKNIIIQLLEACDYLHTKLKVYHGDIKTDNILLKGKNKKINSIINLYNKMNFNEIYSQAKKNLNKNKLSSEKKLKIRSTVHYEIYNKVINTLNEYQIDNYEIDDKYINDSKISLADFGSFVEDGDYYEESFGTRYYRSPENILVGKTSFPNDIWALGCTFYELLTGKLLFNPEKDKEYNRDAYHLKLINEICGPYDPSFLKKTKLWKLYFNSNCELKISKKLNSFNPIDNDISSIQLRNIIKEMLHINPSKRKTARELLYLLKET